MTSNSPKVDLTYSLVKTDDRKGARIYWENHTPHWKRWNQGHAELLLDACNAGWLSVHASEYSEEGKSKKETMLTLETDALRALRDLCNFALGE